MLLLSTAALAQPDTPKRQDRHPAYADEPPAVRVVPIERIHTLEQRWEPVQPLPAVRARREAQNAPTALSMAVGIVPVPGNRLRHDPLPRATRVAIAVAADRGSDLCARHNLRKVWVSAKRWRCR